MSGATASGWCTAFYCKCILTSRPGIYWLMSRPVLINAAVALVPMRIPPFDDTQWFNTILITSVVCIVWFITRRIQQSSSRQIQPKQTRKVRWSRDLAPAVWIKGDWNLYSVLLWVVCLLKWFIVIAFKLFFPPKWLLIFLSSLIFSVRWSAAHNAAYRLPNCAQHSDANHPVSCEIPQAVNVVSDL